jgi:hypothetical protein
VIEQSQIRRPTRAFFSLEISSAYIECRHCLAYFWGLLPEDAEEEDDEERVWYKRIFTSCILTCCGLSVLPPCGKILGEVDLLEHQHLGPSLSKNEVALLLCMRMRLQGYLAKKNPPPLKEHHRALL